MTSYVLLNNLHIFYIITDQMHVHLLVIDISLKKGNIASYVLSVI